MAVIKCKICGGDMEISEDKTFGVCEYCGSSMTLPKVDSEQRAAAFNRGNHFRRIGEFDKALAVYEQIVAEDDKDAEAHWCCALCRFGIEYVEDPATYEWLPTCHRVSFDSFLEDVDYLAAVEYSDGITRRQYQKDATKIAEVQRGILATSQKEEPFDVFICYKESDENGQRTVDSTLAQDIYYQLTEKGRRVFFARITLEDKGGAEYEPYIFAALNSAKVMIVVGTKADNLNAVWVKNEWSRFLSLMKKDHTKLILPCYRDMDPYDLPDQLSVLQSYDMSKIGFVQDLIRGIDKVLDADKISEVKKETVVIQSENGVNVTALIKRGNMALEDGDSEAADDFFDRALDMDAECAEAYLGKALARASIDNEQAIIANLDQYKNLLLNMMDASETTEAVVDVAGHKEREARLAEENEILGYLRARELYSIFVFDFSYLKCADNYKRQMENIFKRLAGDKNFSRAEKYANGALKAEILAFKESLRTSMEDTLYTIQKEDKQAEEDVCKRYEQTFLQWEDQISQMRKTAEEHRKEDYKEAVDAFERNDYNLALTRFQSVGLAEYQKSANYIEQCKNYLVLEEKNRAEEAERQEIIRKKEETERVKKVKRNRVIAVIAAVVAVVLIMVTTQIFIPVSKYKKAEALYNAGKYDEAVELFEELGDYGDAEERVFQVKYAYAEALLEDGMYAKAAIMFGSLENYGNSEQCSLNLWADIAQGDTISAGRYAGVGLKSDGMVVAVGNNKYGQCDISGWKNIVAISAGDNHTVGLKSDGTVVAVGNNEYGQCDISSWENIVAISAGDNHTVGLKSDGTVVAVGWIYYGQCDVSGWENIIAIRSGDNYTVGLKSDGTVVAVGYNRYGQCDVSKWKDIVAVSAGSNHTVGLKSDGTVVAVGSNEDGRCDISDWENIAAVTVGDDYTVGLKSDGTAVAVGSNEDGRCDISDWENIAAVTAGDDYTVGLKSDGTAVAVGSNEYGQCDVSDWTDIKVQD